MYKVAYRKYRPAKFADVIGQPQVTHTLRNELKSGRISHAYLFTGTRGTGKTTCAKILSKAVNCLNLQDGDPCGECEICRGLDDGTILDVVEIDAASNNGVESIRQLIEESNFTPASAKYRVYIIDEVHMLSVQAFNALLKTLEEPPPHVIFILATTEVHKLLPTILSRCQRLDFKHIAPEDIADRLIYVAGEEQSAIERDAAMLIARLADGAMRDALSILDQCLGRSNNITLDVVSDAVGIAGREYLSRLADAIIERDAGLAIESIDSLHKNSKDMSRLCEELAEYFRGLMLIKTMRKTGELIIASESEIEIMTRQALAMSLSDIIHALDTMEETLSKMRYSNPRSMLEMAFVRLCSPELDGTNEALLRRIEALEKAVSRRAFQMEQPSAEAPEQQAKQSELVITTPEPAAAFEPVASVPKQESADRSLRPPETEVLPPRAVEEVPPMRGNLSAEKPKPSRPVSDNPVPGRPAESAGADPYELSRNAVRFMQWGEILDIMKSYSSSVGAAFAGSTAYINGGYMLINAPQIAFDLLKRPSQRDKMRDAIKQVTGKLYKLGPYREPKDQEEKDPLDELEDRLNAAGVPITIVTKDEDTEEEE